MPLSFFKKLLAPAAPKVSRADWEKIVDEMSAQFRDCRSEWFALCVRLLKDEKGIRRNPSLSGRAEVAISVYQCILALEFIAEKQYIPPTEGNAFANHLLAGITYGQHPLLKHELYKQLYAARHKGEGGDVFILCNDVAKEILDEGSLACIKLAPTIPFFTNINSSVVALAFKDEATAARLEQLRNKS